MRGVLLFILAQAVRYVIVSTPDESTNKIQYWKAPDFAADSDSATEVMEATGMPDASVTPQTLLTDVDGLNYPIGVAVDHPRKGLYVADVDALKIFRWKLTIENGALKADRAAGPQTVVEGKAVRWLAVDSRGTLFYTDEDGSGIWRVAAEQLIESGGAVSESSVAGSAGDHLFSLSLRGATAEGFLPSTPGVYTKNVGIPAHMYDGTKTPAVSAPGGIAVDNFHVFWGNKGLGTQVGSVVEGFETADLEKPKPATPIALNSQKVYGVCIASGNIFYTDDKTFLYGVRKYGGGIATVAESMKGPRGCVWDGDGTVYVADETGNKVVSFPSNMRSLAPQKLEKRFEITAPQGLAVVEFGSATAAAVLALLALM
jgi:sugar lactone lactonase YvrE